ncbi:MAG: IS5 family transposase [Methylobacteriaceae bacterium]|nr:IS5 family transposase [Methylobacteriaceae bacterium]
MNAQRRYELSDFEWSIIEPLLPNKPRGVPRADDRKVLNGIYWRLRTGSPWADIPERYGPATTCYNRFVRWRKLGVWDRIFEAVSRAYDGDLQMVDSSSVRVHQHAANVKRGPDEAQAAAGDVTASRCMGRSRGGLTTKIHALVDANGLPIQIKLTEGQAHDGRSAVDMLDALGSGQILLADRGYDSDALRARLAERGAWANIKPMPGRVNIPAFSRFLYRYRNLVERFFGKLKHFRAVATRFEKHDANYLALVKLASARIWMRFMSR